MNPRQECGRAVSCGYIETQSAREQEQWDPPASSDSQTHFLDKINPLKAGNDLEERYPG